MRAPRALWVSTILCLAGPAFADERDAHRLVGILDYVATDYGLAVKDGKVASQLEYEEQIAFVKTARALLAGLADARAKALRPSLQADLDALDALVRRLAPAEAVARHCTRIRDKIVQGLELVVVPSQAPSLERARELFGQACAECHGPTGRADGQRARELRPPPVSFHLPERMERLTPYRVFNAVTFGVPDTAMASFGDAYSAPDRWSLAFYVLALRHESRAGAPAPRLPLATAATSSDAELRERLRAAGAADPDGALATLRARDTFRPTDVERHLAETRRLLDEALAAFRGGDGVTANRLALDSYLQGFDPVEKVLRVRDADLVHRVESSFISLRGALDRGDAEGVRRAAAAIRADLRRTEDLLVSTRGSATVAFIGSFLILFREGLEAALLIGALLGILARIGHRGASRWVHYGWTSALVAGGATYALAHAVVKVGAGEREVLEGILSLLAALVLFYVSYWLLSKIDVQRWMAFLKAKVQESVDRPRGLWVVAGIAFLAVYREAFETVLFYQALLLDAEGQGLAVLGGAACGALALLAAVFAIFRLGKRLPLGAFFLASGALLCLLAAVLAGKGVHALQEAGVFPWVPMRFPHLDWLGLYPDGLSVAVQGAILAALAGAGVYAVARKRAEVKGV